MYDAEQLAETILDRGELPNLGLSWPVDQPYQWEAAIILDRKDVNHEKRGGVSVPLSLFPLSDL